MFEDIPKEDIEKIFGQGQIFDPSIVCNLIKRDKYGRGSLGPFTIYETEEDQQIKNEIKNKVEEFNQNLQVLDAERVKENRVLGAMLGMAVGDSFGSPLEFSPVTYHRSKKLTSFNDPDFWEIKQFGAYNQFGLKPGQWTDDTSMGLCLADSLLCCEDFDPRDLRARFLLWWHFGYCNAFALEEENSRSSVGLGGNISHSMGEFLRDPSSTYTQKGDKNTSGNGSLMRLAPVPIYFAKGGDGLENTNAAMEVAKLQSKTTHQGDEAADVCRMMTFLILHAVNSTSTDPKVVKEEIFSKVGNPELFKAETYGVECMARSQVESDQSVIDVDARGKPFNPDDRNWNWKASNFKYAQSRANHQPGYIGSYAMDAMAMSLHCVWTTETFTDAVLKAANLGGDADTVAAITGQLAGAIYGVSSIEKDWREKVGQWDRGDILLRAYRLFHRLKKASKKE